MNIEATLGRVEHAAERFLGREHPEDIPAVQPIPTIQENPMTTPKQPQRVVDSLHAITAEIQANNLAAALIESQLGSRLSPSEIGTVLAFVGGIEDPRRRAQVQQQHDAQQQAG